MRKETKTKGNWVEIRKDSPFDTAPASESQRLGSYQQGNLKGNEHKIGDTSVKRSYLRHPTTTFRLYLVEELERSPK